MESNHEENASEEEGDGTSVAITWKGAIMYAVMACVIIVSLYFLYAYLGISVLGPTNS